MRLETTKNQVDFSRIFHFLFTGRGKEWKNCVNEFANRTELSGNWKEFPSSYRTGQRTGANNEDDGSDNNKVCVTKKKNKNNKIQKPRKSIRAKGSVCKTEGTFAFLLLCRKEGRMG